MVLLAASIFSKDGRNLLSRQFVEISRTRIEGLLTAFPKLIASGRQHTYVETESVRYVYQPLDKLYILLLTTRVSNILEDLATLRLFAKVIPEYSRSLAECDITESIFEIIFAFDEIVALGYRENVNLAQIKTFTEMDSVDEKAFLVIRESQEKGAIENMKKKVREIQATKDNNISGNYRTSFNSTGFGNSTSSSSIKFPETMSSFTTGEGVLVQKSTIQSKVNSGKTMRLGEKNNVVDKFLDQLTSEGVTVEQCNESWRQLAMSGSIARGVINESVAQEQVHIRIEEKLKIEFSHNAGLVNMELLGILLLKISDDGNKMVRLKVDLGEAIQLQTHPNVDKKMFQTSNILQSKSQEKAFPVDQEIGLLKWCCQTQEDDQMPLLINCWPTKTRQGCSVNIEFELQNMFLELRNVVITIPLPTGERNPTIKEVTGEYSVDASKRQLLWTLPLVDASNDTGSMEFDTSTGQIEDFFPLTVDFCSNTTVTGIKIENVFDQSGNGVKFSNETFIAVDKYEIL